MNMQKFVALTLAGVLSLSLFGCRAKTPVSSAPISSTPPEVSAPSGPSGSHASSAPDSSQDGQTPGQSLPDSSQSVPPASGETFSFSDFAGLEYAFQSGVGAWGTLVYFREEGSFSVEYSDSDMEIQYRCDFIGQFTQPVQVNDYTWAAEIAQIEYERPVGAEEDGPGGTHYIYSEPYGLDGAERILIYLPGAPLGELPEDFVNWVTGSILAQEGAASISEVAELPFYCLYNEAQGQGFSSYDMVAGLEEGLAQAEERTAELTAQIQEDGSLSQGDINSAYHEMYELWDSVLNRVWNVLMVLLPQEDQSALIQEETEWITWKEEQAAQAAEQYGGGSLSILAQSQRAAELTRERVYALMELLP